MTSTLKFIATEGFASQSETPIRWLWEDYLATGMITLLTSRWKTGKTTLVSLLLARLGRGGTLAGTAVTPARAFVLSEEPTAIWKMRHDRLGFADNIRWSCRPFAGRPTLEQWTDALRQLAAERVDLVLVDPLAMFLPGAVENNAAALLDVLEPLHLLTDAGTAVLLLHHPRKDADHAELSPRGTGALTGFVDIIVDMDRPRESGISDRCRRLRSTSRLRSPATHTIELNAEGTDYVVVPTPIDAEGFVAGWPVLQRLLADAGEWLSRRMLLDAWPEDEEPPSKNTLIRWLERAERDGLVNRRGTGRNHDPYCYALSECTIIGVSAFSNSIL